MEKRYSKKIRILSFQNAHNFGAILQAYGLQQAIRSLGYEDVKFINYNPKYLSNRYNPFSKAAVLPAKWSLKSILGRLLKFPFYTISTLRRNRFFKSSIRRLLRQTETVVTKESDLGNEEFDILVCGSDQIWNTALTGSFDRVFLGFGPYKKRGYCISYAPSTELAALTENKAQQLAGLLENFKHVSVRELPVRDAIQKFTEKSISVCVDPTILCGGVEYRKIASHKMDGKKYILIYAYVWHADSIMALLHSIPNWEDYKVYKILLGARGYRDFFAKDVLSEISIEDFLSYLKNASYVITNSFHGLAFSLLFERNFNVAFEPGKSVRCESLLEQLNLTSRFIKNVDSISWEKINFDTIRPKMDCIRKQSIKYITQSLEE